MDRRIPRCAKCGNPRTATTGWKIDRVHVEKQRGRFPEAKVLIELEGPDGEFDEYRDELSPPADMEDFKMAYKERLRENEVTVVLEGWDDRERNIYKEVTYEVDPLSGDVDVGYPDVHVA